MLRVSGFGLRHATWGLPVETGGTKEVCEAQKENFRIVPSGRLRETGHRSCSS